MGTYVWALWCCGWCGFSVAFAGDLVLGVTFYLLVGGVNVGCCLLSVVFCWFIWLFVVLTMFGCCLLPGGLWLFASWGFDCWWFCEFGECGWRWLVLIWFGWL